MTQKTYENQKKKQTRLIAIIIAAVLVIAGIILVTQLTKKEEKATITVGSKAFTEQQILGNLLSDVIESDGDFVVDRKIGLGGTTICWEALKTGSIDLYVDYSGPIYLNQLKQEFKQLTDDEIIEIIRPMLLDEGVVLGARLGFYNDYELTVTREFAEKHNLKTIYDLKALENDVTVAPTFEYVNRADGMLGINSIYGINFKNVVPMEAGLRYSALKSGEAEVINTFTTDGMKYKLDLVALEDPEHVHIKEDACIVFNAKAVEKYPKLKEKLDILEGAITPEDMMEMNYQVDVEGKTPEEVAKAFLKNKGIIK